MKKTIITLILGILALGAVLLNRIADGDDGVQISMQSPQEVAQMFEIRSDGKPENYKSAAQEIVKFYENMTPKLTEEEKQPWKKALCDVLLSKGTIAQDIISEFGCSVAQ